MSSAPYRTSQISWCAPWTCLSGKSNDTDPKQISCWPVHAVLGTLMRMWASTVKCSWSAEMSLKQALVGYRKAENHSLKNPLTFFLNATLQLSRINNWAFSACNAFDVWSSNRESKPSSWFGTENKTMQEKSPVVTHFLVAQELFFNKSTHPIWVVLQGCLFIL